MFKTKHYNNILFIFRFSVIVKDASRADVSGHDVAPGVAVASQPGGTRSSGDHTLGPLHGLGFRGRGPGRRGRPRGTRPRGRGRASCNHSSARFFPGEVRGELGGRQKLAAVEHRDVVEQIISVHVAGLQVSERIEFF